MFVPWMTAVYAGPEVDQVEDEDDSCEHYVEWEVGAVGGRPVFVIRCSVFQFDGLSARWGATGDNLPLLEAHHLVGMAPRLEGDELRVDAQVGLGGTYSGAPTYLTLQVRFDPATGTAGEVRKASESFTDRQRQRLEARLQAGDRIAAVGIAAEDFQVEVEPHDGTVAVLRSVRDAALVEYRAGRDRVAADRILAAFAHPPIAESYGAWELEIPGVGVLAVPKEPAMIEVVNDLGFLLDLGGEHTAAAGLLRQVVAVAPDRAVAWLNLADALWALGDPAARASYSAYLDRERRPTKRARVRSGSGPLAPAAAAPDDAAARFVEATAAGDLEWAAGAAVAGAFRPVDRREWWIAGAREVLRRHALGDDDAIPAVVHYLGGFPSSLQEPTMKAEFREAALIALTSGATDAAAWIGTPSDPVEDLAVAGPLRTAPRVRDALQRVSSEAVVGLRDGPDGLCALVFHGSKTDPVCVGTYAARDRWPGHLVGGRTYGGRSTWPSFTQSDAHGGEGCPPPTHTDDPRVCQKGDVVSGHACGVDGAGRARCAGDDALAAIMTPVRNDAVWVETGRAHTCALYADHTVGCWGENAAGQAPARIDRVVDLLAAADWTCVLGEDGRVSCVGKDPPVVPAVQALPPFVGADDLWTTARATWF